MNRLASTKGFSLLELLVVMAIVALLSSMALPNYMIYKEKAKAAACLAKRKEAENALALYTQENSDQPIPSLTELVNARFLSYEPLCPSGGVYLWKISENDALPYLFCSIHGFPGQQTSPPSADTGAIPTDTATPSTTTDTSATTPSTDTSTTTPTTTPTTPTTSTTTPTTSTTTPTTSTTTPTTSTTTPTTSTATPTTSTTVIPETTTTSSQPGKKHDVPPGLDPAGPPGLRK